MRLPLKGKLALLPAVYELVRVRVVLIALVMPFSGLKLLEPIVERRLQLAIPGARRLVLRRFNSRAVLDLSAGSIDQNFKETPTLALEHGDSLKCAVQERSGALKLGRDEQVFNWNPFALSDERPGYLCLQ